MYKKRRRLLMSSQAEIKRSDNPITECPNCGDDGNDETYSDRSTYVGYCPTCDALTEHYHCKFFDDAEGETCNTKWCSVCGRVAECPICGGYVYRTTVKCAFGTCDMPVWKCRSCGHLIGDTGEDHVDCEEGGEGGEGGDTTLHYCPECQNSPLSGYHGTGICATCGKVALLVCSECGTTYCSNCGENTPVLQCDCGHSDWNPEKKETDMTCSNCELDNTSVYVCDNCNDWYCTNCGYKMT